MHEACFSWPSEMTVTIINHKRKINRALKQADWDVVDECHLRAIFDKKCKKTRVFYLQKLGVALNVTYHSLVFPMIKWH